MPFTLWIDADGTPKAIKEILFRVADRRQVSVRLVANRPQSLPRSPRISAIPDMGCSRTETGGNPIAGGLSRGARRGDTAEMFHRRRYAVGQVTSRFSVSAIPTGWPSLVNTWALNPAGIARPPLFRMVPAFK